MTNSRSLLACLNNMTSSGLLALLNGVSRSLLARLDYVARAGGLLASLDDVTSSGCLLALLLHNMAAAVGLLAARLHSFLSRV